MSDDREDQDHIAGTSCPYHGIHADGLQLRYSPEDRTYELVLMLGTDEETQRPVASVRIPVEHAESLANSLRVHEGSEGRIQ